MRRLVIAMLLMAAAISGVRDAAAQETINTATISGRVTDPTGSVVPGAQVTARQTDTNVTRETVTDSEGRFRFPYLKLGPYDVIVRLQGFKDATRALTLTVGSAFELPIALSISTVDTTVNVQSHATILEAARSQIAGTVSQAEVRNLPMNGRNFLDLALQIPGVSPTNIPSTQLFPETSAIPGNGISIGSQRNFSNSFIVDGLSANDDAAGLSGMPYGVDAVDQFQVVTSGGQAELGRALGGYVNVVTKSGTNNLHGDLYGYFRDDSLNASNALSGTTLPMNQQQYGASAGGPIVQNRTFYFANVERRQLEQSGLTQILQPNVDTINARLSATGYPGSLLATGIYPTPVDSTHALAKVDHQFNDRDQFGVRYSLYKVSSDNSRGAGGLNAPSASAGLDNIDSAIAVSNTLILSSRTVNETRAQFAYGHLEALPSDPIGPAVSISGIASFGTMSGSPTGRVNSLTQVVDNLSHQAGAHALRAGVDFQFNDDRITYPRSIRGQYAFSTLANFLSGAYNNAGFTQTFGATEIAQTNPNLGFYAQDEWKVSPSVTLNLGLRYDLEFLETISTDTNNLSPRAGFAWTPFASRRTIIRGSGGMFYDRVPLRPLANALLSANNTTNLDNLRQINVSLSPAQTAAPVFPAILDAPVPLVTLVNLTTMDPDIQNAYSRQASVEIEQQIGDAATVSVGYQYLRGENLIISINQNVPSCIAAGNNNGCRPNPAYANNSQYSSAASSNYHGLFVSFVQRPAAWGNYRVSYTLSKSMNNVGENFFSSPIDPFDLNKDWGRADDDQRHRLVISGAINSPMTPARGGWQQLTHGFQLSGMLQYYSALPLNITSGLTTIQGTTGRPIVDGNFIARNSGTGADFFSLNARVSRTFAIKDRVRLEGLIEGFNLTNRRNVVSYNANFGSGAFPSSPAANFRQVLAVNDPRSFQVAARLRF